MGKNLALKSFRLKNFKAIRDSGVVKFTPLTVLIGDNGSGKSSLVEGLQTYQRIVTDGLDSAMGMWQGFEFIRNAAAAQQFSRSDVRSHKFKSAISFRAGHLVKMRDAPLFGQQQFAHTHSFSVTDNPIDGQILIFNESLNISGKTVATRNASGEVFDSEKRRITSMYHLPDSLPDEVRPNRLDNGISFLSALNHHPSTHDWVSAWQFAELNPSSMLLPYRLRRSRRHIRLHASGSNIAQYLLDIRDRDKLAYDSIIETVQYVLPYMKDMQPTMTTELNRSVYLQMAESEFKIPGWLLSTGTLRILCLLALFRHPEPPPLIIIEELENGLDPRTIHLIVEEVRNVVESGRSQVIVTTHSPYLLDLLPLWSIVLVEREDDKGPVFFRPAEQPELDSWLERFGPGKLYTMQGLRIGASQ